MTQVTYEEWKAEFSKVTSEYINGIDWDKVIWNDGEFEQAGDELQLQAYLNLNESDSDLNDWEFYDSSCDDRIDAQQELQERWDQQVAERNEAV